MVSERWRYIVYSDGTEELYDRKADGNEFTNLAGDAKYVDVRKDLAQYVPKSNAKPVPAVTDYDFNFGAYSFKRK